MTMTTPERIDDTPDMLAAALAWQQAGVSVIPVEAGTKRPATPWRTWQQRRADDNQIRAWFTNRNHGIGLVCGAVSGNLEMLEFEGRAIDLFTRAADTMADHDLSGLWRRLLAGCLERSPSGGVHLMFRVDAPVGGNTKIARRDTGDGRVDVLIETRGEGGYTVAAPTVRDAAHSWKVLAGGPETLPTITADEHAALHAALSTLDEMEDQPEPDHTPSHARPADRGVITPFDDFDARTDWKDILEPLGWTRGRRDGMGWLWTRPGKRLADGPSASTGRTEEDRLWVWSTSVDLPAEEPMSKAWVWAHYNTAGNLSEAAKRLAQAGYGTPLPSGPALTFTRRQGGTAEEGSETGSEDDAVILTESGNGDAMAAAWSDRLKWVPSRGQWITWNDMKWVWCDDNAQALAAAAQVAQDIPADTKAAAAWRKHSLSRRGLESCAKLASTHPEMRVSADQLDADALTLCTPGGLVSLKDGHIDPPDPKALCTRATSCTPDFEADTPRWDRFLTDTFGGDEEMIGYIQRLLGVSAIGQARQHILPFMYGSGANGKSVLADVVCHLLGDYASTAPSGFLMAGHADESAIARLSGLRMVVCSEVNKRDRFDEAKVKLLTGGDTLTARFLYGRHFSFTPTHTLWLMGNDKPRVESGGESFWRRTRLIGFDHTVPPEKRIDDLASILINEEGPGILAWIVRGAIASADGLADPDRVLVDTAAYAAEEDHLARFMDECVVLGSDGGGAVRIATSIVRAAYLDWCREEGEAELSATMFGREIRARWGVRVVRSHGRKFYAGLRLLDPDDASSDDESGEDSTGSQGGFKL